MTIAELITHLSQYPSDDHVDGIYLPPLQVGLMAVGRARLMNLTDGSERTAETGIRPQIALRSAVTV